MPRQINTQVENNFVGGLVTEATALNFPENACTETDNCVFQSSANVFRRYGMDFEYLHQEHDIDTFGKATSSFVWENPAGVAKNFFVFQAGRYLHFFRITKTQGISTRKSVSVIDLDPFKTSTTEVLESDECQFAYGQGYLFVVHPTLQPLYVKFTSSTDTFEAVGIDVKVRDTEGVEDDTGFVYDTRPATLTDLHAYNLYNQGWFPTNTKDFIKLWQTDLFKSLWVPSSTSPPGYFSPYLAASARTDYPSNADVWWIFKDSDDMFNQSLADSNKRGNTPAPKGYFVMDAWNMNRIQASKIIYRDPAGTPGSGYDRGTHSVSDEIFLSGIPRTTSGDSRPSTVAFFAGRVFYAGVAAQGYSNKIFFTQVIKNEEQFGRCHQLNDPTNENLFDLLATDGGTLTIPDCGRIYKMVSIQNMLLVFANNGVWSISGNVGIGFTAGDYTVRKVSSVPSISFTSFVDVGGLPYWWNFDGIYRVAEITAGGGVKVESITQDSIRTYFKTEIPVNSKLYARGAYNYLTKEIRWLWNSEDPLTVTDSTRFNKALSFNVQTSAFYPWTFSTVPVRIQGIASITSMGTNNQLDGNSLVAVNQTLGSVFKYILTFYRGDVQTLSFGETLDTTFVDFKGYDGVGKNFRSYLVTGYKVKTGEASKKFQSNYITVYLRNYNTPKVVLSTSWDFSNSNKSGRFSSPQTLSFPETPNLDYFVKKVKVRGSGKALQIRFSSVNGEPFDIAGWTRTETTNASV